MLRLLSALGQPHISATALLANDIVLEHVVCSSTVNGDDENVVVRLHVLDVPRGR